MYTTSLKSAFARNFVIGAALCGGGWLLAHSGGADPKQTATPATAIQLVNQEAEAKSAPKKDVGRVVKSEEEWKKLLTPQQFYVLRQKGTERAFSGDYASKKAGTYHCAGCGLALFSSTTKFDSGTGWPSFWQPIDGHVKSETDADGSRVEVLCARCDGHLGHVFEDGPKPTGLRYCINSVSLSFTKQ